MSPMVPAPRAPLPTSRRPLPLAGYTDAQLTCGTSHGVALAPVFVATLNLRRLQREGITLHLHPHAARLYYRSDSGACYVVGDGTCNCPAGSLGRRCRHQIGVQRAGGVSLLRNALAYAETGQGETRSAA